MSDLTVGIVGWRLIGDRRHLLLAHGDGTSSRWCRDQPSPYRPRPDDPSAPTCKLCAAQEDDPR